MVKTKHDFFWIFDLSILVTFLFKLILAWTVCDEKWVWITIGISESIICEYCVVIYTQQIVSSVEIISRIMTHIIKTYIHHSIH